MIFNGRNNIPNSPEGLDLEFFDDQSGKLITCGSTTWSMWRCLSNHKAKQ